MKKQEVIQVEEDIQEEAENFLKELKVTSLKNLEIIPNNIIKTEIVINDIQPGINLIKAYVAKCPECNREKIIYRKTGVCKDVFKTELKKEGKEGCSEINSRGKKIDVNVETQAINDTGYTCTVFDPEDRGSNPQLSPIFIPLSILPKDLAARSDFEMDIQTKKLEITGVIRIYQTNMRKFTDWFIDVTSFKFVEKQISVDKKLLYKFKDLKKDDQFFQENYIPKVYGRLLDKKIDCLNLLSPYTIRMPNKGIEFGILNVASFGDPGQSKTVLANESLKYCKDTNASLISVENSTNRGLLAKAVKSQTTGQWMIVMGEIPKRHKCKIFLDGYGKLEQDDQTQMRGIQEEKLLQVHKAGNVIKECGVRNTCLGNILKPVADYPTKHKASFDLAATTSDRSNKFSGADRRRFHHIVIVGDSDTVSDDIDKHLLKDYHPEKETELIEYWNNLREFAWNLKEDQVIWDEGVEDLSMKKVSELKKKFDSFSMDYGILGKGATPKMFMPQLPAVAILHGSINDKGFVEVKKEYVEWLFNLYLEEFRDLGLSNEMERTDFYNAHADKILNGCGPEVINYLQLINQYGSQTAVEATKRATRMSMWRSFKKVVTYNIRYDFEEFDTPCFYSFIDGSGNAELGKGEFGEWRMVEIDGELPPLNKRDGTITEFGKILIKRSMLKKNIMATKKVVTPVTLDTIQEDKESIK